MSDINDPQVANPGCEKTEIASTTKPSTPEPIGPTELTDTTFDEHVKSGYYFIKFYTNWCGYSKQLAPIWDELAISFNHEKSVGFANVDCTANSELCRRMDIKGYPTLLWLENGKMVEKCTEDRKIEALRTYVSNKLK